MVHWNNYMNAHTVVSDQAIPQRCAHFIHSHTQILIKGDLRQNLLLHLCNLWDEGVISSTHILDLISIYDSYHSKFCIQKGVSD